MMHGNTKLKFNRKELTGAARCHIHGRSFKRNGLNVYRHIYINQCVHVRLSTNTRSLSLLVYPNFYS